jgi:hypothetical protein
MGTFALVSFHQRCAAARYLGLEKDWFYQARETADCPGCGEKVRAGVAVCKTCRAILDRDKAAALGLVPGAVQGAVVAQTSAEAAKSVSARR